jgi:non-ribosomal peptide synthetase component F
LIGFFVNTLILRTDLHGDPTFLELLDRVRQMTLEAYAHQDLPFEQLVEALRPDRNLSHSSLFQVMFVLQNTPQEPLLTPGLSVSPLSVRHTTTSKFDLVLSITETAQALTGTLGYNSELFEQATIADMLTHFQTLLAGIVAHPQQRLSELPIWHNEDRFSLSLLSETVPVSSTLKITAPDDLADLLEELEHLSEEDALAKLSGILDERSC